MDLTQGRLDQALEAVGESASTLKETATSVAGTIGAAVHAVAQDETLKNLYAGYGYQYDQIAAYRSLVVFAEAASQTQAAHDVRNNLERAEAAIAAGDPGAAASLLAEAQERMGPMDNEMRDEMTDWMNRIRAGAGLPIETTDPAPSTGAEQPGTIDPTRPDLRNSEDQPSPDASTPPGGGTDEPTTPSEQASEPQEPSSVPPSSEPAEPSTPSSRRCAPAVTSTASRRRPSARPTSTSGARSRSRSSPAASGTSATAGATPSSTPPSSTAVTRSGSSPTSCAPGTRTGSRASTATG